MVVYASFNVQLHGLACKTQTELNAIQARIKEAITRELETEYRSISCLPTLQLIDVTLDESAGKFD